MYSSELETNLNPAFINSFLETKLDFLTLAIIVTSPTLKYFSHVISRIFPLRYYPFSNIRKYL